MSPGIPPRVDAIVLRGLEKDPTRRWPSVGVLARALRDWREEPAVVSGVDDVEEAVPSQRGSLLPTFVVVVLILAALGALLWTGFRGLPLGSEEPPATVIVPSEPVITGGLDDETSVETAVDPLPTVENSDIVTIPAEVAPAPTIAPAGQSAVVVPNLQGLTIAGVTQALLPLQLRVAIDQPVFSDTVPLNAVVSQQPPPGTTLQPGETVRVSLSRGPSPFADGTQP
jgi:hypothetical protein